MPPCAFCWSYHMPQSEIVNITSTNLAFFTHQESAYFGYHPRPHNFIYITNIINTFMHSENCTVKYC